MTRCRVRHLGLGVPLICLLLLPAVPAASEEGATFRDLVRRYQETGESGRLAQLVGFAKPVRHVVALDYTILLRVDGDEKPVDPKGHRFRLGDRIRVRIQPMSDVYVYLFHEGASGERVCLLPDRQETAPLVEADDTVELPPSGYFEFVPPAGTERLVVVATERPIADLALLSNVVFKKPGDELTPEEEAVKKTFQATVAKTLESIRARHDQRMTFRGLPSKQGRREFAEKVQSAGATQVMVEEPPHGRTGGTLAMVAGTEEDESPNLLVTIPLESVGPEK
jgi:hypothetical protein